MSKSRALRVATCQFSVEGDVAVNRRRILRQISRAAEQEADVVHFSETALSGYAGVDRPDVASIDWDELVAATRAVQAAARAHGVWVLLGSTHRLSPGHKPHNSVYVIDPRGDIVDRYDKRFCTGREGRGAKHDLKHYTPGDRFVTFRANGFTCGVLGVEVLFHSFHNARKSPIADQEYNIWKTIVPATMACRAAENHFWVSANNSTARPSRWGSFAVRPDGLIVGRLPVHKPGVLITEMRRDPTLMDAPGPWRETAMRGVFNSGTPVDDPRSRDVCAL